MPAIERAYMHFNKIVQDCITEMLDQKNCNLSYYVLSIWNESIVLIQSDH